MLKRIAGALGLQGVVLYDVTTDESKIVARVGQPARPQRCPHCGGRHLRKHSNGIPRLKLHSRVSGKPVYLEVTARRYRCCCCQRTFSQSIPGVNRWQRRTSQAEIEILEQARAMSLTSAAAMYGLGYHAARACLDQLDLNTAAAALDSIPGELHLGVDEHSFRGRNMVVTVTLLYPKKQLLQVLVNDRQTTLVQFLMNLPEQVRERITQVCIDMSVNFKHGIQKALPHALIVIDKFHLVHDANYRIDQARIIESQMSRKSIPKLVLLKANERLTERQKVSVEYILSKFRRLNGFYWMKEQVRQLYNCCSVQEAQTHLGRLILNAENGDDPELLLWAKTLRRWRPEILNYFISRTTNAYTEGVHTKVKWIKRTGFGFRNLEVYVKRVVLAFLPAVSLKPCHTY